MNHRLTVASVLLAIVGAGAPAAAADKTAAPAAGAKTFIIVFNFAADDPAMGTALANSCRLRLARHEDTEVLDHINTAELSPPLPASTTRQAVLDLMAKQLAAAGIYGTISKKGAKVTAEVKCVYAGDSPAKDWSQTFTDSTERYNGQIAKAIAEKVRGQAEWVPPEAGSEAEPKNFGQPCNVNGTLEAGPLDAPTGWDLPDNVSTFVEAEKGRGRIARIRTDLARDPWLEYTMNLRLGKADRKHPPKIPTDTGYSSVGGLEGVHYCNEPFKAKPGRKYWIVADYKGKGVPKIFIKGFKDWGTGPDAISESALARRKLTPDSFAKLPEKEQKRIIAEEARLNPASQRRECYRFYMNLNKDVERADRGEGWKHYANCFPPRGGLPADVEVLQIQLYPYWPAGEYKFDNVFVYEDPSQKAPLPEEKARTPNFRKGTDNVGKETSKPAP